MELLHQNNPNQSLFQTLTGDCQHCCGLCCAALYFAQSEGFPADKPAGSPCENLLPDFRCAIHEKLLSCHLKGCVAYDCLGAGQKVTQQIYHGETWYTNPKQRKQMFEVFLVVVQLQQMLWYLAEAGTIIPAAGLRQEMDGLILENIQIAQLAPEKLLAFPLSAYRLRVNQMLQKVGTLVLAAANGSLCARRRLDFMGKDFKKANLQGKDFSMTLLIGANLAGCCLYGANFLGADLRDTNLKNTDLRESIFLTQGQINAAKGDHRTQLPPNLVYPASWETTGMQ